MGKKSKKSYSDQDDVIDFEQAREARKQKRKEKLEKKVPTKMDALSQRRQAKRRRFAIISTAIILLIAAIIATACLNLWKLNKERDGAKAELEALNKKQASMENELSQIESSEYIEQEARAELHMILPGETMYVIPIEETTNSAIEQDEEESDAKPND